MDLNDFIRAKHLREQISLVESRKAEVKKMKSRPEDEDFTKLKSLAYEALSKVIEFYEKEFSSI